MEATFVIHAHNLERKFLQHSKLHIYLCLVEERIFHLDKLYYPKIQVLLAVQRIIAEGEMFDERNPHCLILDEYLEEALGLKFLHVSELQKVCLAQMESILPLSTQDPLQLQCNDCFERNGAYRLKPAFFDALKTLPRHIFDPTKNVYKYNEIPKMVSTYLLNKKEDFLITET